MSEGLFHDIIQQDADLNLNTVVSKQTGKNASPDKGLLLLESYLHMATKQEFALMDFFLPSAQHVLEPKQYAALIKHIAAYCYKLAKAKKAHEKAYRSYANSKVLLLNSVLGYDWNLNKI